MITSSTSPDWSDMFISNSPLVCAFMYVRFGCTNKGVNLLSSALSLCEPSRTGYSIA